MPILPDQKDEMSAERYNSLYSDGGYRPDMIPIQDHLVAVFVTQLDGLSISLDNALVRKATKYLNIASIPVTVVGIYDLSVDVTSGSLRLYLRTG